MDKFILKIFLKIIYFLLKFINLTGGRYVVGYSVGTIPKCKVVVDTAGVLSTPTALLQLNTVGLIRDMWALTASQFIVVYTHTTTGYGQIVTLADSQNGTLEEDGVNVFGKKTLSKLGKL